MIKRSLALSLLLACGQNDDPEGARQLYARTAQFRSWRPAPGYATRQPSFTAHADSVQIYVNDVVNDALDGPKAITAWPDGAIIVKEGFSGDDAALVAIMEKRAGKWFWAEFDSEGEPLYSGEPKVCVDCHERRKSYSDWVYAFELPR